MTRTEVDAFARQGLFEGRPLQGVVEETHISWVVLTATQALKIKKPVKFTFLDFSTPALRKYYCEKELALNRRFTDIYLSVQPIAQAGGAWHAGGQPAAPVDYCVVMKRLATVERMDNRVARNGVRVHEMQTLARKVAGFHDHAAPVYTAFDLTAAQALFNDISSIGKLLTSQHYGVLPVVIAEATAWSDEFLARHATRFQKRIEHGMKRDVHGDLHCGNIFLCADPVIFDCIEFNDQYRQIDVLYEVAFLCMDLEASGQQHLADAFLRAYRSGFSAFECFEDEMLFLYFKALRANVRAKVHAMEVKQDGRAETVRKHVADMVRYVAMMERYMHTARSLEG
ncbi:phosphotransferase [Dawidia soli]|uniref:Phosphotransferase n=1 Tax=Dawidia soli TaxID=2782352 RepID=A0AAP2GGT3_9BACT|nr:phosphotransferase [Dawidia soli]MBT1686451.1 phosphotransferase [Dawidia soli]